MFISYVTALLMKQAELNLRLTLQRAKQATSSMLLD
jgi:hypothetical protein